MKTIPGGCYRRPDGKFYNASGELLPPDKVRQYFKLIGQDPPQEFAEKPKAKPKPAAKKTAAKKTTKTTSN